MMPQIRAAVSLTDKSDGGLSIKNNSKNDNRHTLEYEDCRTGMSVSLHSDWRLSGCHNWMEKRNDAFPKAVGAHYADNKSALMTDPALSQSGSLKSGCPVC